MSQFTKYSYTILRYVHDMVTGESVNVGVLIYAGEVGFLDLKVRTGYGRIHKIFPDLERKTFLGSLANVRRIVKKHSKREHGNQRIPLEKNDAISFAQLALPRDDSSLQWSDVGFGLVAADSLSDELEKLYHRLVVRYDVKQDSRRDDNAVWRPISIELKKRNIDLAFEEKTIVGQTDTVEFKRAWKNGDWHCYEPLSMDLKDSDGIKNKARKWLGHLTAVNASKHEEYHTYFLVGAPENDLLNDAYEDALGILKACPGNTKVFKEENYTELVDLLEDQYRHHSETG